jgi:alpha/beta superfamily hydrolase
MQRALVATGLAFLTFACAAKAPAGSPRNVKIDFESMAAGDRPEGFTSFLSGTGVPPVWNVTADSTAPSGRHVLVQSSRDETGFHFPLCILDGFEAADVAVTVRWKSTAGRQNRSGGIVTRFLDADHFYLVRFNSLEDNINFYCYDRPGHRDLLTGAYHIILMEEGWHTLRVEWRGTKMKVWHDGAFLYEAEDSAIRKRGRVGLWTKSDSVTYFDDFEVECLDRP